MAATAGKKLRIALATALAGPFTNFVAGVKTASLKLNGAIIDVTTLTDTDLVKIMGMRDSQLTFSGNFELDTNGQKLARDAQANDTQLWAKFMPDGGTTANINTVVEVKVSDYTISGDATGEVSVSVTLEGTGARTTS